MAEDGGDDSFPPVDDRPPERAGPSQELVIQRLIYVYACFIQDRNRASDHESVLQEFHTLTEPWRAELAALGDDTLYHQNRPDWPILCVQALVEEDGVELPPEQESHGEGEVAHQHVNLQPHPLHGFLAHGAQVIHRVITSEEQIHEFVDASGLQEIREACEWEIMVTSIADIDDVVDSNQA